MDEKKDLVIKNGKKLWSKALKFKKKIGTIFLSPLDNYKDNKSKWDLKKVILFFVGLIFLVAFTDFLIRFKIASDANFLDYKFFELIDKANLINSFINSFINNAVYYAMLIFGLGYLIKSRGNKPNYRNLVFLTFIAFGFYLLLNAGFTLLNVFEFNTNNIYNIFVNAILSSFFVFSILNFCFLIEEELKIEFNKFLVAKVVLLVFAAEVVQNIVIQL